MKQLIVNADDFGLTPGVNRAILELNSHGVLTSATLMATADSFEAAAQSARNQIHLERNPNRYTRASLCEVVFSLIENPVAPHSFGHSISDSALGVGCHVTLVDGKPLLTHDQIPHLTVGTAGLFRETLGGFVRDLLSHRIPEREIEAEATAQIRRLQAAGVTVTHVDTHKHTHMFPGVYGPLLRAASACGVRAIRNPFEPEWATRATRNAGRLRRLQVKILSSLRTGFLKACVEAGIETTDGAIGVLATGSLDSAGLRSLLEAMPDGTWELCCHPGYQDAELLGVRTRLRESRETEREALLEVLPREGISLIHFGEIEDAARAR